MIIRPLFLASKGDGITYLSHGAHSHTSHTVQWYLEALSVDNGRTRLVVLLLGDPHLLEGGEGGQDGSSDPDGVFPLGRSDDLDLHGGRSQCGNLLLHPVTDTGVHGGTSAEDGVGVQILPDVNVALHDGVVGVLVDSGDLKT